MGGKVERFPLWGQILYSSVNAGFTIADPLVATWRDRSKSKIVA